MSLPRPPRPAPPADFPVYGLDPAWPGARWLESFGDAIGDPVRRVTLGHLDSDGASVALVETHSRARTDAAAASCGELPLEHVAHYAAVVLVNITLPVQSLPRPDGMLRALALYAGERAREHPRWSPVGLRVGGATVTARAWRFAGGWAVVSDAVDGVYLAVTGVGIHPGVLPLGPIPDGGAYHFRLDQPLHPDVLAASRAARTGGDEMPWPQRGQWHDDQLRVLRERA